MPILAFIALTTLFLLGPIQANAADLVLRLATTTSTANTGLLDYLAPRFQKDTGIELQFVAVGTGKALALGRNCDVDALMVHAPAAEKKFVAEGYGQDRREIMYNDFVIIGPPQDPAGIKGLTAAEALAALSRKKAAFASRGDDSGTHKKEISLWQAAGLAVPDREGWYLQTGQGMIATINVASEREAYTMTDRGTYIKYQANNPAGPPLVVLVEGDPVLYNQYGVIAVSPVNCPKTHLDLAQTFSDWITSEEVQKMIGEFKLLGQPLFIPNAE